MKERVVTFGPEGILVGIVTEPDAPRPGAPVVVMSNVGLNHRVGPSRAWVDLARGLAKYGVTSLRYDCSGLGDSAPRKDLLGDVERSILDLEDALAMLTAEGATHFALVSWCSGTDNSHVVAVRDPRVVGAAFLDGYAYTTPTSLAHAKIYRWVEPPRWRRALRRRFPRLFGLDLDRQAVGWVDEIYNREYPTREKFEEDLATLVDRGARLLFVYSQQTTYAYKGQFWDWLRRKEWGGQVAVEYYSRADHTFRYRADRTIMMDRLSGWLLALSGA
ncbi:MAG TPA: hypothetical protein VIY73_03070 [Polyangiaceae bacterium]